MWADYQLLTPLSSHVGYYGEQGTYVLHGTCVQLSGIGQRYNYCLFEILNCYMFNNCKFTIQV